MWVRELLWPRAYTFHSGAQQGHCTLQVKRTSKKMQHRLTSDSESDSDGDSSESDNVLEDYLSNLQCDSDASNSYEQQVLMRARSLFSFSSANRWLGAIMCRC